MVGENYFIHNYKSEQLFGHVNYSILVDYYHVTLDDALNQLKSESNDYNLLLKTTKQFNIEIESIMNLCSL